MQCSAVQCSAVQWLQCCGQQVVYNAHVCEAHDGMHVVEWWSGGCYGGFYSNYYNSRVKLRLAKKQKSKKKQKRKNATTQNRKKVRVRASS
jgi:hypothetical protein